MTDSDLPDLLDRLAERSDVGPAPVGAMLAAARRTRRRRGTAVLIGAAASVALVAAGVGLAGQGTPLTPPDDASTTPAAAAPIPDGFRLVAVGRVGILVPEAWPTNEMRCGTATADTVIVDVGVVETCALVGADVFDSVWIHEGGQEYVFRSSRSITIGSVAAERQDTVCETYPIDNMHPNGKQETSCTGSIHVLQDVYFAARSATAAGVDRMLSRVTEVPEGSVGVPGTAPVLYQRETQDNAGSLYADQLRALGLRVETVRVSRPGSTPDFIIDVSPRPGTVLAPGDTVTVTVVAPPSGPGEELSVGVNSVGPGDSMDDVDRTDEQIRAGTTIHLAVGSRIWAYGAGHYAGTLAGELNGDVLAPSTWADDPNLGHSWEVVRAGTTTITLTITADGERIVLGTVRVVAE